MSGPQLVPPKTPLDVPRGRYITADGIVKRWFMDPETGEEIVSARWVRLNMPYKQVFSHSRVAWFENDVAAVIAEARTKNIHIKDVKLDYLEKAA